MMKPTLLLFLFYLLFSCGQRQSTISGHYQSIEHGRLKIAWNYYIMNKVFSVGSELDLLTDSTFSYYTCGNHMTGTYNVKSDSLILCVLTNEWRDTTSRNTLRDKKPAINQNPYLRFFFKTNIIRQEEFVKIKGKTYVSEEILEKVER